MNAITSTGYIVADNNGTIHGLGATADLAWEDMERALSAAGIAILDDDADSTEEDGSWTRASGMKIWASTQGLLDDVAKRGGTIAWDRCGMVACTCDEAEMADA